MECITYRYKIGDWVSIFKNKLQKRFSVIDYVQFLIKMAVVLTLK